MQTSISDIDNELGLSEIIGNYVKLTQSNFLELFELALDKPSYNLLLLQLERMAINFVKEMANRKEIESEMNSIIDKGVIPIDIKTGSISFTTRIHRTKLNNMLENKDVQIDTKIYNGKWKDLKQHGNGVTIHKNGDKHEGTYLNENMHNKGIYTFKNGDKYEGDFLDNNKHGKGIFVYNNGDKYEGDFINNNRHGNGIYTYNIGGTHSGEYKNDEKNGKGIFICIDETYEGLYVDNNRTDGCITYKNGDRYEGQFKYYKPNGKGIFVSKDGDRYEGEFVYNKYHGQGSLVKTNGEKQCGNFIITAGARSKLWNYSIIV